jgi:integrase
MRGSIKQRGKSWLIQVYTGKDANGKHTRYYETVKGRKGDAQRRLTELLASLDKGIPTPAGKLTVAEHLQNWLNGYVKTNCSERTLDGYKSIIGHHLTPSLGHFPLKQLTPQVIQAYYGKACRELSTRTVHHQHRVLSQALKHAVRQGLIGKNPCELIDSPRPRAKTMRTLDPTEVNTLLKEAEGSYYYPIIYTALSSGLSQAELFGLRWRDLDPDIGLSISVSRVLYKRRGVSEFREPKTSRSRRYVSMTPKLATFLREYKQERRSLYRELGKELSLDDLIFANIEGKPLNPPSLNREFGRILKRAGLENVRFHDLRHSFASLMLLRGPKPKVISEALGHASVAFTMDVYSHIIEGMQSEAMALLDEVLPVGVNGKSNDKLTTNLDIKASSN